MRHEGDLPRVSPTTLQLHARALLISVEQGRPGFIPDALLAPFGGDATVAALELCLLGVWSRVDGGYRVIASEALRMAEEIHRANGRDGARPTG